MPRIKVDDVEPDKVVVPVKPESQPAPAQDPVDQELKAASKASFFSAFSAFPDGIFFSGEEAEEQIILLLRAHIVTNAPWILITVLLLVLPIVLVPLFGAINIFPMGAGTAFVFVLLWYAITFTYAFINFLYWYFNVYILTDERVVDVDWYSIIYRKVSSAQVSKIQDVSASQGGVFAGIFDYGDVQIQTAGEEENFEFTAVPHPQLVAKKIQEMMQVEEKEWEGHNDA